ncbi:MAG: class I SAM-dependent methyltransferase [Verrucomicrobiales bacterium]|nr:class I SAM-dependent methyltransferase [Verrucomicrobiales bacterium]
MTDTITFSFGKNWQAFLNQCMSAEREQAARASLQEFLEVPDLRNRSFLDIGCGSGLFSLAAHKLGASRIVSVDKDPFAVACTERLRESAGRPGGWSVMEGSVLDDDFMARLEPADIVYAWGSLHHTGEMWKAIRNAGNRVRPGGAFYLAIYNRSFGRQSSEHWLKVKERYNRAGNFSKRLMEWQFVLRNAVLPNLVRGKNPLREIRQRARRGMDFWVDVRDWLGGLPYEYASVDEVFRFCSHELGMQLDNIRSTHTTGCNEFLFRKLYGG